MIMTMVMPWRIKVVMVYRKTNAIKKLSKLSQGLEVRKYLLKMAETSPSYKSENKNDAFVGML